MTNTIINYTGKAELDIIINDLNAALTAKDKKAAVSVFETILKETIVGGDIADWITEPQPFTQLKSALTEHFAIQPRMLQLKNRIDHRHRRAVMFAKVMLNALQRIDE